MVFDSFRRSFDDLLSRATKPEERRVVAARMKDTLVQARVGLDEMRSGLAKARQRLVAEEGELETVQRRKRLAEGINDQQTVDVAAKYEEMHTERVEILRKKVEAQEAELSLAEREVGQMTAELKAVMSGSETHTAAIDTPEEDPGSAPGLRDEIDSLGRARARAEAESDAARRLEELKRKMGR